MGSIHQANGQLEAAIDAYEAAIKLAPLSEALTALVDLHTEASDRSTAQTYATLGPPPGS